MNSWSLKLTDEEHNMDDITQLQHKSKRWRLQAMTSQPYLTNNDIAWEVFRCFWQEAVGFQALRGPAPHHARTHTHTHTQAKSESHFAQGWYTKGLVAATMQCRFLPCLQRIRNITMHSGLIPPTPKVLTNQNGSGIIPFWICATSAVAGIPDMATPILRALSKVQEFERYPCITDACQPPGNHSADTFRANM
mgnify:CR=1 FL=1